MDPGRAAPGWDRVTIEGSKIWLAPLPAAENGFAAGAVPGENAVDTKAAASNVRSRITIRDTIASGFRAGLIGNMAAFNFKEHVDATVDGVTVFDSEIAFRLRGPDDGARVLVKNAVVHDVTTAFRYEDDIQNLRIWNSTVGRNVSRTFLRRVRAQRHPRRAEPALDACAHLRGEAVVEPARHRIVVRRRVRSRLPPRAGVAGHRQRRAPGRSDRSIATISRARRAAGTTWAPTSARPARAERHGSCRRARRTR